MSEIAVIKGNDVRDKKLADSTAQTEVASTDGIRMVTTTGEEVYIARDSFANEVMKVINENVKTTVDGVFGVSGNEFGKITPANLAKVVGVVPKDTDRSDETRTGAWRYGNDLILAWLYITPDKNSIVIQLYFSIDPNTPAINHVYTRVFSTKPYKWSSYKEL